MKWKHLLMTMSICLFLANPASVSGQKLEAPQQAWEIAGMPLRHVYELLSVGDQAFAIGENVDHYKVLLGLDGPMSPPREDRSTIPTNPSRASGPIFVYWSVTETETGIKISSCGPASASPVSSRSCREKQRAPTAHHRSS